jgi:hypothetical protein
MGRQQGLDTASYLYGLGYYRSGKIQDWNIMGGIWGYNRYYFKEDRKVRKPIFLFFRPNLALILFL